MCTMRAPIMIASCLAAFAGVRVRGDGPGASEVPATRFPVLSGIGVALSMTEAGPQISKLTPGSAAERSGKLKAGDRILTIRRGGEIVDLKGKGLGDVTSLIRGPAGTTITLEILPEHGKSSFQVTLKREAVALPGLLKESTYEGLIGEAAPTVEFPTLDRHSRVTLPAYAGRVVVLDFWASWCGTCYAPVDKMQEIARAHPEWDQRVVLLTVTIDSELDAPSRIIKKRKWDATTHLSLAPELLAAIGIATVPAVIIISPDGKIASVGDPHSIPIEKEVERLLPKAAPGRRSK